MSQLISNLPNGSLIKFGSHSVGSESPQPIIWMVVDKNHSGYPSNSVTLITQKIIDLVSYDAREVDDYEFGFFGDTNYKRSNLNQWLNSDARATEWYSPLHSNDNPPTAEHVLRTGGYYSQPGFLYNFTTDEKLAILSTTVTQKIDEGSSTSISAKIFLPSLWETIGTHDYADGSSRLSYFTSGSALCGVTSQVFNNTSSTSKPAKVTDNWSYMTRNANDLYVFNVTSAGKKSSRNPYDGDQGLRPLMNLSSTLKVTDTTDSDGCYTVVFNELPVISGTNSNLGVKNKGFSQTYTVGDEDDEIVTVAEYIDNVKIRSYVATLGATNTFSVTGETWLKLANGIHTLKITATDGVNEVARVFTFTKTVNVLVVQRVTPITSSTKPTRLLVTVVKSIPPGAKLKVEACNNGFDASPTWEDITSSITSGQTHVFANTAKTAGQWGVNIRVTVDRNGSEGACYITEIGGNFE